MAKKNVVGRKFTNRNKRRVTAGKKRGAQTFVKRNGG
jgi:hypothetical protein